MDEIFDEAAEAAGNAPEYTVSELSGAVKRSLEDGFGRVRVRGEVGRVSRPRSGHVYLDLKDDRACVASVIWKGAAARLEMEPTEGDEVIAEGRLTTFAQQSKYQLVIDRMRYAGAGALLARLERLKAALAEEGLFAAERKRPIPYLPQVIGVVTSPSGAVIRDILHRLEERFPMRVLVWPVAVQGAACAGEVAAAIRGFNALPEDGPVPRPDVLIVARGGGSVEDLWGFNEEIVVRAAAESAIPLISAVGHETDTTLIDFAADRRAPTPTAAAEIAAPVRRDLVEAAAGLGARAGRAMARMREDRARRLRDLARLTPSADEVLAGPRQRLDRATEAMPRALKGLADGKRLGFARSAAGRFGPSLLRSWLARRRDGLTGLRARLRPRLVERAADQARARLERSAGRLGPALARRAREGRTRLSAAERLLGSLNYKATLARGFAVVRGPDDRALTSAAAVSPGTALSIEFADGRAPAIGGEGGAPAKRPRAPRKSKEQGSLF